MENSRDAMAGLLDGSFILVTSALHLITVVLACPLGLIYVQVWLISQIHYPFIQGNKIEWFYLTFATSQYHISLFIFCNRTLSILMEQYISVFLTSPSESD